MTDFYTVFSTTFALLGLKLLFGTNNVSFGSVLLLTCISAAVSSAWVGGSGKWMEDHAISLINATLAEGSVLGGLGASRFVQDLLNRLTEREVEVDNL